MTRQKQRVATDNRRSSGCRKTPLEHWSKRKPTVEPRWAKQQTKKLRPQPTKINSFMSGPSLSLTPDPIPFTCNNRKKYTICTRVYFFSFFVFAPGCKLPHSLLLSRLHVKTICSYVANKQISNHDVILIRTSVLGKDIPP